MSSERRPLVLPPYFTPVTPLYLCARVGGVLRVGASLGGDLRGNHAPAPSHPRTCEGGKGGLKVKCKKRQKVPNHPRNEHHHRHQLFNFVI